MINENLEKNIELIKKAYYDSKDLKFKEINFFNYKISLVFINSLISDNYINQFILKSFNNLIKNNTKIDYKTALDYFISFIPADTIKEVNNFEELYKYLGNGFTGILFDNINKAIVIETKGDLARSIDTPTTEQTISGPKDSFTENYITNIGLVRKRIKTKELVLEEVCLGKQTDTKVGILYMNNIIEYPLLEEIKKK